MSIPKCDFVGSRDSHQLEGLFTVHSLSDNLEAVGHLNNHAGSFAERLLVIDDQDLDGWRHRPTPIT